MTTFVAPHLCVSGMYLRIPKARQGREAAIVNHLQATPWSGLRRHVPVRSKACRLPRAVIERGLEHPVEVGQDRLVEDGLLVCLRVLQLAGEAGEAPNKAAALVGGGPGTTAKSAPFCRGGCWALTGTSAGRQPRA
jgi:hypothetical protein